MRGGVATGLMALCLAAAPARAQSMADMPGMTMAPPAPAAPPPMESMDHADMAGMEMPPPVAAPGASGTDLPPGQGAAPALPVDHYADRFFPAAAMERARAAMMREGGGQTAYQLLFNLAEIAAHEGHDGYRWDGEAYVGGDINRLWVKSEGEGSFGQSAGSAEVQALFSHAVGPYYNLQMGLRQDFAPGPGRTYATIGVEGLAPYQFETGGALFLSDRGDVLARLEAWHDARVTQRLVLQPRVEFNLSAQDAAQDRHGAGLVEAELGLRLRYEIRRGLAPYVGVSWARKTGRSADYARADGERPEQTSLVMGLRSWF